MKIGQILEASQDIATPAEQQAMFREYRKIIGMKPLWVHVQPVGGGKVRVGFSAYTTRELDVRKGVSRVFDVPLKSVETTEESLNKYTAFAEISRAKFDEVRAKFAPVKAQASEASSVQVSLADATAEEIGLRPAMVSYNPSTEMLTFDFDEASSESAQKLAKRLARAFDADMSGVTPVENGTRIWLGMAKADYDALVQVLSESVSTGVGDAIVEQLGGFEQLKAAGLRRAALSRDGVTLKFKRNAETPDLVEIRETPAHTFDVRVMKTGNGVRNAGVSRDVHARDLRAFVKTNLGVAI